MSKPDQELKKPDTRYLKSGRVAFAASSNSNVDKENRTITNVILCQVGPAKGHGVHLEQEFIEDGIAYAQKHWEKVGMKSRFGHPAMSNDALGSEVGRFRNFRVEGDKMVADLQVFNAANLSPTHPGMGDWLLAMAQEDPSAIMCSIVFTPSYYYQKSESGEKVKVWEYDKDGNYASANQKLPVYVAMGEFNQTDIVDEGAATDRLFSADVNSEKFAVKATEFLDSNPQMVTWLKENAEKIPQFTEVYEALKAKQQLNKGRMKKFTLAMGALLLSLGFGKDTKEEDLPEVTPEHLEKLNSIHEANQTQLAENKTTIDTLTQEKQTLLSEKADLEKRLAAAERQSAANLELAEKYRAASGEAFSNPTTPKTDVVDDPKTSEEEEFGAYAHNQEALATIKNL
ncbi:hypothetical protein [Rufibacter soli]